MQVPPTDKVCLWLGANVMLEYSLGDAEVLLKKNCDQAEQNLAQIAWDLDYLRDQMTITEVGGEQLQTVIVVHYRHFSSQDYDINTAYFTAQNFVQILTIPFHVLLILTMHIIVPTSTIIY